MEKNKIFDALLEKLKEDYENGANSMIYVPEFVKKMAGDDNHSRYICETLNSLGLVTAQKQNGSSYMWTVMLNATGADWIEKNGSWSEFKQLTEAPEKHGVRLTKKNIEILNRTLLFLHHNNQNFWNSLNELTDARRIHKFEHFICSELDWITSQNIDGELRLVSIDNATELEIFISDGMFNYLLSEIVPNEKSSNEISSLTLNINAQNVTISIITEALTSNLTREQIEELRECISTAKNETDKKNKIIQKIGSFGQGVAEKVLANILSKGETWQAIGKGLENLF